MQLLEDTPALLYFGKLCKAHGYTYEWSSGRQNREVRLIGSSKDSHRVLPQLLHRHRLRRIYLAHWNKQIREVTRKPQRSVAKELLETATEKVFPNGWRTSQRTSRSQKYLHPQIFLMAQIRNVTFCFTHFPADQNCEVFQRTKITGAPCRRRTSDAAPRAESFGDLMTANHQVLNEGSGSRRNYRYSIVVQDFATQWIQSYPCRTETSEETAKSLRKFLEPSEKAKVIYTDNSLEFGKSCEDLSWNHRTSRIIEPQHLIDSTQVELLKEQYAEQKKGHLQCCCNLAWSKNGGLIRWNAVAICDVPDLLADSRTPYERRFGETFEGPIIPFEAMVQYFPISVKDQSRLHQFRRESCQEFSSDMHWLREESGREVSWLPTLGSWEKLDAKTRCKENNNVHKR